MNMKEFAHQPILLSNQGHLGHKWDARARPFPWTPSDSLTAVAGAPDVFGDYLLVFAAGTYDFGDTPNEIQVREIVIEAMSANDTYIIEISSENGGIYTPVGAIRFARTNVQIRSFVLPLNGREFNNDTHALYARLKSALGASTATFSLTLLRHLGVIPHVDQSTGVFPFG